MKIVITGGSASGKSAHAEHIICKYTEKRLYLATMMPFGECAKKRIERHLALRHGKGFDTQECFTNLKNFKPQKQYDGILLECMSNLLANEMFAENKPDDNQIINNIIDGINALESKCNTLVIVTGEVFSDGESYPQETENYCKLLGNINRQLFSICDIALESVCGILVKHKGETLI